MHRTSMSMCVHTKVSQFSSKLIYTYVGRQQSFKSLDSYQKGSVHSWQFPALNFTCHHSWLKLSSRWWPLSLYPKDTKVSWSPLILTYKGILTSSLSWSKLHWSFWNIRTRWVIIERKQSRPLYTLSFLKYKRCKNCTL